MPIPIPLKRLLQRTTLNAKAKDWGVKLSTLTLGSNLLKVLKTHLLILYLG